MFEKRKVKITMTFEADLDPVPGWGYVPEDWVAMIKRSLPCLNHQYHESLVIDNVEVLDSD